jgi:CRP/FNR family transcriptional regulator, cyclic AMP receptor protein
MRTIEDLISGIDVFAGMRDEHLALIAGCGQNVVFRDGDYIFREGDRADTFFAIRDGMVALEIAAPARPGLVIETLEPGEVLGWSWLFEPYRTRFDARAVGTVRAVAFDGACLRGKCDADTELGYELTSRFVAIITERLQATRLRLLDVYGHPSAVIE